MTEPMTFENDKLSIDELFKRSLKYRGTKAFFRFCNFIARFHHYSRFNTMLVYLQNEAVTFFGGVNFWRKKFHREVKENARPYVILQPFAPTMLVYDVFDTEGMESPEDFMEYGFGKIPFRVNGYINRKILENSFSAARDIGVRIEIKPLSYFNPGYVTTIYYRGELQIALKEGQSNEQHFAVLMHELGHLFLGHTGHEKLLRKEKDGKEKTIKLPKRNMASSAQELEAETVSFLICSKLGLSTSAEEYLAGYISSERDLEEFSYETVIKTADKIESLILKYEGDSSNLEQFELFT
jgi:hypothetical protein